MVYIYDAVNPLDVYPEIGKKGRVTIVTLKNQIKARKKVPEFKNDMKMLEILEENGKHLVVGFHRNYVISNYEIEGLPQLNCYDMEWDDAIRIIYPTIIFKRKKV